MSLNAQLVFRGRDQPRPDVVETTALTAADLAGIALGVWRRGPGDFLSGRSLTRFEPQAGPAERERRRAEWSRAVATALTLAQNR